MFKGVEFHRVNKILGGVLKEKKRTGREEAVHNKNSITEDADRALLDAYFDGVLDSTDPRKLTFYV